MQRRIREIRALTPNAIEGTFYAFPRLATKVPSKEVARKLLDEYGVAVLPGTSFGGASPDRIRLSFSCSREDIDVGMDKLGELLSRTEVSSN